jgi:hypothetical protein
VKDILRVVGVLLACSTGGLVLGLLRASAWGEAAAFATFPYFVAFGVVFGAAVLIPFVLLQRRVEAPEERR